MWQNIPNLAKQFKINEIPTVIGIVNGTKRIRFFGSTYNQLIKFYTVLKSVQ